LRDPETFRRISAHKIERTGRGGQEGVNAPVRRLLQLRAIKDSNRLSAYSWGVGIDIDSEKNPFGAPRTESKGMMPLAVVKSFESEGWKWGGRFKKRLGCMRFHATK
jgi:D-alanyl-D-alanine carboxypeptidase